MRTICVGLLTGFALATAVVDGQSIPPDQLVRQLQGGGYVLVMRHASSPREAPSKERANADNPGVERQLDEAGRRGAAAMGNAVRALKIPVSAVLTSPAYRARETVARAGLMSPTVADELGDQGKSMQGVDEAQAIWLRRKAAEVPRSGNILLVTHQPNLSRAFPAWGATMAEGETAILRPDGRGTATLVGRIAIESWPGLR